MTIEKLLHYFPGAEINWTSVGDWSALEWFGPGEKPSEAEFDALPWPSIPTLAEAQVAKKAAIKEEQATRFLAGWTHDFGTAGVHTLDLRNADDKVNWTLLLAETDKMIAAGAEAALVELRTQANERIEVPAAELNAALASFLAWGKAMLSHKWDLDDEVNTKTDLAGVASVDETAGWP